jgi:cell division protein FtsW
MTDRRTRNVALKSKVSGLVRRHKPDYRIILYMGLLMLLGLVVMYAIGPQRAQVLNMAYGSKYDGIYFFAKQAMSLVMALGAFFLVAKIPITWWQAHAKRLFIIGIIASALLAIGGAIGVGFVQCSLGACRWFNLGPLGSIQPAEFLKFGTLLFSASFLAYRAKQGVINDLYKTLIPLGVMLVVVAIFVIGIQKDMGTGLVLLAIVGSMVLVSGVNARVGAIFAGSAILMGVIMVIIAPHRIGRIATFLQGDNTTSAAAAASNYHIVHALIAIGSGGPTGVGIGNSVQATGYLPEAINDSVFAIMGETFGFVGLVIVLLLFGALLLGLLRVADRLPGLHEKLIVVGVFGWLGAHVILNVAAMTGVFPLTGITLPLLSFGGTSMVFIAGALGLAFQLSSYTVHSTVSEGERYEDSHSRRGLGRPRYASRSRM